MRLFIAEKPSVGKAIAEVLGGVRKDGYFECGDDIVTWCFGHLFELAEPDEYLSDDIPVIETSAGKRKQWRFEDLPIFPDEWRLHPKSDAKDQIKTIKNLLQKSDLVVNAGDPDREGQLLIDELLEYFGYQKPVLRYWSSAPDEHSVRKAINDLKDNALYEKWGQAAKARQRADWLIGMNLSRAFTLKAQESGTRSVISVGRVQTPTLTLIVNRDEAIEKFKPIPFFTITATFKNSEVSYQAKWQARETQNGLDEEGRLIDGKVADALIEKFTGKQGNITRVDEKTQVKNQPLSLSLTRVTAIASSQWGYTQKEVLDTCQSLYETHRLTTYPRTDCDYLPGVQHQDAPKVLAAVAKNNPNMSQFIANADTSIKSKTWNDKKVTAHYGIIPTMQTGDISKLGDKEKNIYDLVCRYYIAQFYEPAQYNKIEIETVLEDETFLSKASVLTKAGWTVVLQDDEDKGGDDQASGDTSKLKQGQSAQCEQVKKNSTQTKPPARFTEGSIGTAMANIHRYVIDDSEQSELIKKTLKDGEGIGTTATRASIIEELKKRSFIENKGKYLVSTTLGRSVVHTLPITVKSAVLTALNERQLQQIIDGDMSIDEFVAGQQKYVTDQIQKVSTRTITIKGGKEAAPVSAFKCQTCGKGLRRFESKKKKGMFYWACSGYPQCNMTYMDFNGRPNYQKAMKASTQGTAK